MGDNDDVGDEEVDWYKWISVAMVRKFLNFNW